MLDVNTKNPFSLYGRKILITGASSGLGRQCAIQCSNSGAQLIITGRNRLRLEETVSLMSHGSHELFEADLEDYSSYETIVNFAISTFGKIDGFVHSAGIELSLPVTSMQPKYYEQLFKVNVISGFEIAKFLISKKLVPPTGGSLVFMASSMGELGQAGKIGYCSSKGALVNGVRALALELASKKIRVNSVSPSVCKTKMTETLFANISEEAKGMILKMHPLGLGDSESVAHAVVYLLSDAAKWVTGSNLKIDGGYSAH